MSAAQAMIGRLAKAIKIEDARLAGLEDSIRSAVGGGDLRYAASLIEEHRVVKTRSEYLQATLRELDDLMALERCDDL